MPDWTLRLDETSLPDRSLIGGKAWSIARMLSLGLNVPPAFVVTTQACSAYLADGRLPDTLESEVDAGVAWLETRTGRRFARGPRRLLLSVRSGAAISMPGMMDTVLNLGIDAGGEAALAAESAAPEFARDTHRRFRDLYAAIVLKDAGDPDVPATPREQLSAAIRAVFDSWNTRRARKYRQHHGISDSIGTAVTVQAMVFGNLDDDSGTGVLFSRNPLSGAPEPFGEYLPRAQGEDVVSGKFTPLPLGAMKTHAPAAHGHLLAASALLERENGDVQDIEFTVQNGELFLLQSRSAKRAPEAAARIAVDMVEAGLISIDTALTRVTAEQAAAILLPRLDPDVAATAEVILTGEGACPGIACGVAVGDPDEAEARSAAGEAVILVRDTTSPDDIHGMIAARGVVTAQGGATSHAAVVSRALGRPCVVGCGPDTTALVGRPITVDGSGRVFAGELPVTTPDERADPILSRLSAWAAERSPVKVTGDVEDLDPAAMFDVGGQADLGEPGVLAAMLKGKAIAMGAALATPAGAREAWAAGVQHIVTTPVLPALLAILAAQRDATS